MYVHVQHRSPAILLSQQRSTIVNTIMLCFIQQLIDIDGLQLIYTMIMAIVCYIQNHSDAKRTYSRREKCTFYLSLQRQYLGLGWFSDDNYSISVFYTNTIMVITEPA